MALPTAKTPPITDPSRFRIFLHGHPKIGKSTWCASAPNALFLATEAGLGNLDVYQVPVLTWEQMLTICAEVADGKHQFKTVVIDTIDNAHRLCCDYICRKHKVEHESDLEYGKGFAFVRNEFFRVLTRLSHLPYGLILVSHSIDREIKTRTGDRTKTMPTLPEKAAEIALGLVDIILFADLETTKGSDGKVTTRRVLRTKPSLDYEAGDRTGRLPETLGLDYGEFVREYGINGKGGK